MIQIRFVEGRGEGFESCLALRIQVFVEELGVDSAPQDDEWDAMAAHALLLDEKGEAVATARLYPEDRGWKVGRVCVKKTERGKGYGEMVVRAVCAKAFALVPDSTVRLHARLEARDLYEKLGFAAEGAPFWEAGMEHVAMAVTNRTFCWSGRCGKN